MVAAIGYHEGPNLNICLSWHSLYIRDGFFSEKATVSKNILCALVWLGEHFRAEWRSAESNTAAPAAPRKHIKPQIKHTLAGRHPEQHVLWFD